MRAVTYYTVTNVSSSASFPGSLPWAVYQANNVTRGLDIIVFNIPGSGAHSITLTEPLVLTDQVVIDAKSQPGYSGSPLIVLQGTSYTPNAFVLQNNPSAGTTSSGSTIAAFAMYDFPVSAITVSSTSTGDWIQENWIGFYLSGSTLYRTTNDFPDPYYYPVGITIQSTLTMVRNNTISGLYHGVVLGEDLNRTWSGAYYRTNVVQLNMVGTDPTGSVAYGNVGDGIRLVGGAQQNYIGPNNVLSGNLGSGCELLHSSVVGNIVYSNRIGLNAALNTGIQNGGYGVVLANNASGNMVGGASSGNYISGNTLGGVAFGVSSYPKATGNWLFNNLIGLNGSANQGIYGQGPGVLLQMGATGNVVSGNAIGGNNTDGIQLTNAVGNGIYYNWIGMNPNNGAAIANGGYAISYLDNSSSATTYVIGNVYGGNIAGQIYRP